MPQVIETVGQIALPVSDSDRSEAYYRDKLGLLPLYRFGNLVFFDAGNLRLMLEGGQKSGSTPGSGVIYFCVADIDDAFLTLKAKGIQFDDTPHMIARMPDHELWMVFLKDPDGHQLALMCEKRGT